MREFSFKVWNIRRWLRPDEVALTPDGKLLYCDGEEWKQEFYNVDVHFSTGITDGNKKEIYDCDLLRYADEDGQVFIGQPVFETNDDEQNPYWIGWKIKSIRDITDDWYTEDGQWKGENPKTKWDGDVQIIGNIHENPELLVSK